VLIVVGLLVLDRVLLIGAGQRLAERFEGRAAPIAWSTIVPSPYREQTELEKRLAKACLDLRPVSAHRGSTDESLLARALGTGEVARLSAVGEYLACTIERAPDRFCAAEERQRLVSHIQKLTEYRKTVLRREAEQRALDGNRPAFGDRRPLPGAAAPTEEAALERIAGALRGAVEIGYLPTSELAALRRTDIGPLLTDTLKIESSERPCQ
jgi:hypothetical protein